MPSLQLPAEMLGSHKTHKLIEPFPRLTVATRHQCVGEGFTPFQAVSRWQSDLQEAEIVFYL